VELGKGTRVWHHCHIMRGACVGAGVVLGQNGFVAAGVIIGDGCRIQNNVSLFDGVVLEDDVFVGPSVVFTNVRRPRARFPRKDSFETTHVEAGATLGANCTIICGTRVGRCAMVGAGAVVTVDVPPFALAVGSPARVSGWVCRCGEPLSISIDATDQGATCNSCGREYAVRGNGVEEVAS